MTTALLRVESSEQQRTAWIVAGLVLVLAGGVTAAVLIERPILLLSLAVGIPTMAVLIIWPNVSTLLVVFVLFTNAAAIAVNNHGVPFIVGAGVPLLLAIPVAYAVLIRREPIVIDPVLPLALIFLGVQIASALFAENQRSSLRDVSEFMLEGLLLFFLITNAVRTRAVLRQTVWVLLFAGSLLGGLSLFQRATKTYRNDYGGFAQIEEHAAFTSSSGRTQRQGGPLGQKNRYAQIMLMVAPLGLACAWGESSLTRRMLGWAATALILIGVALTFSRGAAVAFFILMAVMLWMRIISVEKAAGIAAVLLILLLLVPQVADRMRSLIPLASAMTNEDASLAESDGSIRSRAAEMMSAVWMFADHALVGVGPGMYSTHFTEYARRVGTETPTVKVKEVPRRPHILYLGIAAELGVFGLFTFLLIIGLLTRNLNAVRWQCFAIDPMLAHIAAGFLLAIVAYLATGLFLHLAFIRYLWLFLGLAAAAARIAAAEAAQFQPWSGDSIPASIGTP